MTESVPILSPAAMEVDVEEQSPTVVTATARPTAFSATRLKVFGAVVLVAGLLCVVFFGVVKVQDSPPNTDVTNSAKGNGNGEESAVTESPTKAPTTTGTSNGEKCTPDGMTVRDPTEACYCTKPDLWICTPIIGGGTSEPLALGLPNNSQCTLDEYVDYAGLVTAYYKCDGSDSTVDSGFGNFDWLMKILPIGSQCLRRRDLETTTCVDPKSP